METSANNRVNIDELFILAAQSWLEKQNAIDNESSEKTGSRSFYIDNQSKNKSQIETKQGCC